MISGEKPLELVLERLDGVRRNGEGYTARCPAHEDDNPSLSVREGDDGRVLLKCFAGCGTEEVIGAVGMSMAELFEPAVRNDSNGHRGNGRRIAETYDYTDEEGNLLFEVVRYEPKDFRQRRPDGHGGWTWNLKGVEPVLYRLPEVLHAVEAGKAVFVVEGEKDADRLAALGFAATASPMGAGKWHDSYAEALAGGKVVIVPDNDPPGREHADRVATSLARVGAKVKVLELPGLPEKGDASDWLDAGGSAKELARLAGEAPVWEPAGTAPDTVGTPLEMPRGTFTATDLLATELPPVRWAVPGVLPEGVTILAGKPKLGKSWLALGLCVAVASGGTALGSIPVERGEALYLALEDNRRRLQRRLRTLLGDGPAPEGLHLRLHSERLDQGGAEALGAWLAEHPGCRLVVIDTLKKVRPKEAGRRAVYDSDYEALEPLLPVAAEHGVSILVVHHLRKMNADDPLDAISGSTGLTGGVDGTLILARERGQADAYLHIDGRDVEESRELALRWDRNVASWTVVGDAEDFRLSETRRAIRDLLENADGPMSARDVAIGIGKGDHKGYSAVRQRLYQMSRDGEVKVVARGKYTCITSPYNKHNNVTNIVEEGADVTAVVTRLDDHRNNGHGEKPIDKPIVTDVMDVMADDRTRNDSPHAAGVVVTRPEGVRNNVTNPLPVEQVVAELERPGSGPAKALATYREKPGEERFMYLVKAILHSRGIDLGEWDHHRDTVRRAIEGLGE